MRVQLAFGKRFRFSASVSAHDARRPEASAELRQSAEADIAPKHAIDKVDLIDAVLGEDSEFHHTHGFYVHGVPIEAAKLPAGWERRAIKVQNELTRGFIGWCLEAHDLAASKLAAFREKDREFRNMGRAVLRSMMKERRS